MASQNLQERSGLQMFLPLFGATREPDERPGGESPEAGEAGGQVPKAPIRRTARRSGPDPVLTRTAAVLARGLGLRKLPQKLRVEWNPRLRTTAGRAYAGHGLIELNPRLQDVPGALGEIERTLLHELAHLVAYARAGRRRIDAHGPEWQQACRELGIPGESRCHSLALAPGRKVAKRFAYQCPACSQVVLRVRKFKRYSACYACCRLHNRGAYDRRFEFVPIPMEDAERILAATENGGA